ncbi:hypothetical protein R69746_08828 [Paraburkholderia aspalathi]|nr:hypothetical protein R69746_08828 [Paraburkholderia aspalathi]
MIRMPVADSSCQRSPSSRLNMLIDTGSVTASSEVRIAAMMKSFHDRMKQKMPAVTMPGNAIGIIIW